MAYKAEIQIGVKGIKDLRNTQAKIERLSRQVDEANKKPLFNKAVVANLQTYNAVLAKANKTLNKTQIELDSAGNAANNYKKAINNVVTAQSDANEASRITSRLLKEEVANRNAATTAVRNQVEANIRLSKASREASNFSLDFDPAIAKSIARRRRKLAGDPNVYAAPAGPVPSELQGQSSLVEQRIQRQIAGSSDLLKVHKALEAQEQRTVSLLDEKLNITRRITNLSESQKGLISEKQRLNVLRGTGDVQEALFKLNQRSNSLLEEKLNITRKVVNATREERLEAERLKSLRTSDPRVSLRGQERPLFVQEKIELGRSRRIARESSGALRTSRAEELAKAAIQAGKLAQAEFISERKTEEIKQNLSGSRINLEAMVAANQNMLPALREAVELAEKQLRISKQGALTAGRFSPIQGSEDIPGSPLFLQARRKRRQDALSSGLIGGAFPLLFGQGGGAAIGGGIGGFAGGLAGGQMGFALSLVGTQFGAFADQIVGKSAELGQALNPLTADLDALISATGNTGSEIAILIGKLKEADQSSAALALATSELTRLVGADGVAAFEEFGAETIELSNEFSRAMTIMMAAVAGLINSSGVLRGIVAGLENTVLDSQIRRTILAGGPEAEKLRATFTKRAPTLAEKSTGREPTQKFDRPTEATRNLMRKMNEESAKNAKNAGEAALKAKEKLGFHSAESVILRKNNQIAQINSDLTNDKVYQLSRDVIFQQARLRLEKEGANQANIEVEKQTALTNLSNRRNNLLNKSVTAGAKIGTQLETQLQQSQSLTATLERQLAQSKVAGSQQAQKLKIEAKYEQTVERIAKLKNQDFAAEQVALADQIRSTELANLEATQARKQAEAIRSAVAPIKGIREGQEASLAASKEYNRLLMEGVLPSEAKRIVEFNKQVEQLLNQKTEAISLLELDIARAQANGATTTALQEQLDLLKQQKEAIESEAAKGPGKSDTSDRKTIEDRVAQLQGEITEMTKLGNVAIAVADNVGAAFSTAFQSVVNGTKTTREALSDMFRTIGENFVAMAADIIAKQLVMITLQTILKALGAVAGASGGGGGVEAASKQGTLTTGGSGNFGLGTGSTFASPEQFAPPTIMAGSGIPGAANGGPVLGGQPYMVGERGPELFVPGQSGGVMRNEDMRSLMGRSPASGGAPSMNFSFETTSIGGTEYVSREQLESAMAVTRKQASNDGAKRGMSMTLDRMQNSPRTRTRIGLR